MTTEEFIKEELKKKIENESAEELPGLEELYSKGDEWECLNCGAVIKKENKPKKCESCGRRGNFILREQKAHISKDDPSRIFTKRGQIESFQKLQPFFYDKSKMFWLWDWTDLKWVLSDEVDLLNSLQKRLGVETISSKTKTELISGLQQIGRTKIPEEAPSSWIQFGDEIIDFKTGRKMKPTPDYFVTNSIPWELGESEETPTINKLIKDWVGEEYKETLEQAIGYSASSEQFMQRLIALVGGGSNGKGTFIKLLKKFLGIDNVASSELKELSNNQFETSAIYRKLLCVMGEVSYDDLRNTNQIKQLAGEDDIRYCFKGKTPFRDKSITTIICQTNSLPRTPDKTLGFYRKWLIIDFPNQFTDIKKGLIENIPEWEFKNLALKVVRILKELHKNQKFKNEGNFEERVQKYEERSNPVIRFVENNCSEDIGENTELRLFTNKFNEHAKKNHLRIMSVRQVSKILREEGFEVGKRKINSYNGEPVSKQVILNLSLKTRETRETTESSSQITRVKSSEKLGSSGSSGGNLQKTLPENEDLDITYEKIGDNRQDPKNELGGSNE